MPDKEKIIKEFEHLLNAAKGNYQDFVDLTVDGGDEILAMLKEQEPIPCGEKIKAGDVVLDFYECGYCKNAIRKPWRYCPFCGKAVKWE